MFCIGGPNINRISRDTHTKKKLYLYNKMTKKTFYVYDKNNDCRPHAKFLFDIEMYLKIMQ